MSSAIAIRYPMRHQRKSAAGVRPKQASLEAFWAITVSVLHVPLALLVYRIPLAALIHAVCTLVVGVALATMGRRRLTWVACWVGYVAGVEVIWRMAEAPVFWEYGKYIVSLTLLVALLRSRLMKFQWIPVAYFALLIPSVVLTVISTKQPEAARAAISGNLSGPLALMLCGSFFAQIKLTMDDTKRVCLAVLIPTIGIAAVTIYSTAAASHILFTGNSNKITSGGFGPNQVSSTLGLGVLMAWMIITVTGSKPWLKLYAFGAMGLVAVQSAMTFSRGGLYNAAGGVLLATYPRSAESRERLLNDRPDLVVTTGPFQYEQPAVIAVAKNLGIPTAALIPSWDNLSTKPRMVFKYDGYLVWSEREKQELHDFYPQTRSLPVHVVGAPQFDILLQGRFRLSRKAFCAKYGLRPSLPIIVYAVGSPNFISGEHHGALYLAERVACGDLGDVQLIVRPHPLHDNGEMAELFRRFGPRVVLQQIAEPGTAITARSQDERQITEWVNTFRHADVVINLFSTVTVDAAIFNRPVINLDYDPSPGQTDQALINDVNHLWTHYKPIAESGGVWLVKNPAEMVAAVREYLLHPELHAEKRRWIAKYVCEHVDGHCGERMAQAVIDQANCHQGKGIRT